MAQHRVIVVGGGLAGLAAAVRIVEAGVAVDLFSLVPVKRSHSVCAQGGINACNEVARQQGYSEFMHFDETIYGGDFLADQPPVYELTHFAPRIIDLLDRMGVPFNRTSEGFRDLRLFGGSLFKRTHFAGASTGQQLMYALDEQVRRYETEGKVTKYEFWDFLAPVLAEGEQGPRAVGIVAQDLRTMQIRPFRGDAVVIATGGCGVVFGKSTNSVMCTGAAAARCYRSGAWYGNPEFIQVHPTAIPGADKCRLMSESARGEGGRVWVPRTKGDSRDPRKIPENERWYFLEEKYPKYGNLVPRDIATREIFAVCMQGMGVRGQNQVYLDLTHKPREYLDQKLGAILEIYEKFVGEDPREMPMRIFPAVHYSMGGLWTTFRAKDDGHGLALGAHENAMTNIRGLYAFGEANFAYHGATRLGANALLSCIFDGLFCGLGVANYVRDAEPSSAPAAGLPQRAFDAVVQHEERLQREMVDRTAAGGEADASLSPYVIASEMGDEMTAACTVVKTADRLRRCIEKVGELRERAARMRIDDGGSWSNQTLSFGRAVEDMLLLADLTARASLMREESRGSHYRDDFPERDDSRFLKTTVCVYQADGSHRLDLREVSAGIVKPRPRTYGKVASGSSDPGSNRDAPVKAAQGIPTLTAAPAGSPGSGS